jgi:hypothetical protein
VVFLHVGWPPGTGASVYDPIARQYVRDPEGAVAHLRVPYSADSSLPGDARFSGYRYDGWELWFSQENIDEAVYFVRGKTVERWPRPYSKHRCSG